MAFSWGSAAAGGAAGLGAGIMTGNFPLAGIAALGGFLGGGMYGGQKKKDDPLAAIRQQLINLAAGVPAQVEKQKGLIGQQFGRTKEEGLRDIGTQVYAERNVPGTIEKSLETDFISKLALQQAMAELEAEMKGTALQGDILRGAAGVGVASDEPSFMDQLGGVVGTTIGTGIEGYMGEQALSRFMDKWGTPKKETMTPYDIVKGGEYLQNPTEYFTPRKKAPYYGFGFGEVT